MVLEDRSLVEEVTLPSRGVRYGGKLPGGLVRVGGITLKEEKILAGNAANPERKVNLILQNCVDLGPSMTHAELLVSDRQYLLFKVRQISYGPLYGWQHQCGGCKKSFRVEIDLRNFAAKVLEDTDVEPFYVDLPIRGHRLGLRTLRGSDEEAISQFIGAMGDKANLDSDGDPSYYHRLAMSIESVDGEPMKALANAVKYLTNPQLESADSFTIRDAIDQNDCGLEMKMAITCAYCGNHEADAGIPLSAEFFRPTTASIRLVRRPAAPAARPGDSGVQHPGLQQPHSEGVRAGISVHPAIAAARGAGSGDAPR